MKLIYFFSCLILIITTLACRNKTSEILNLEVYENNNLIKKFSDNRTICLFDEAIYKSKKTTYFLKFPTRYRVIAFRKTDTISYFINEKNYESNKVIFSNKNNLFKILNKYKYNGKELQDEMGLNTYAYGWRDYDPAIVCFLKVDRFTEKYSSHSPYNYEKNNPIRYREMVGDSIWVTSTLNKQGTATNFVIHFTGKVYNSSDRCKSICKRFTESHEKSVNWEKQQFYVYS